VAELAGAVVAQCVLLTVLAVDGLGVAGWLAGLAYAVLGQLALAVAVRRRRMTRLGAANRVTLTRMILVGGVTALVADGDQARLTLVVALTVAALVLDGVDGYVARRTRTVSELGARFDMEVDAFLILVLSLLGAASLGPWVLAIGAMRYVFVAAGWGMPWLREPLPPSFARKTIAAVQGISLVVAASGIVPRPIAALVTAAALILLIWSFGRDIRWLWQHFRGAFGH
jgi:phosphatidylglycerophosphate synthase